MMFFPVILSALLALDSALLVTASLFFLKPENGSTCVGGQPCTLEWLDDGNSPLLNAIGIVTAGLYTGQMQLVQTIPPLTVSNVHSIQFTPIAQAGPNSDSYYIAFTSTTAKVNGTHYIGFSPFFTLKGMSGSFSSPLAAATSTFPLPTRTQTKGTIIPTTITVGSIDTSLPSLPSPSISKSQPSPSVSFSPRFTTSSIPASSDLPSPSDSKNSGSKGISTSSAVTFRQSSFLPLVILSLLFALTPMW